MIIKQTEIEQDVYKVIIPVNALNVRKSEIESNLGYGQNSIPIYFSDMIDSVLNKLNDLCEIKVGYRLVNLKKPIDRKDGLFAGEIFFKLDKIVTSQLKKSTQAALFLCTIGNKMEKWSMELLRKGEPTESFIVDSVASAVIENVADKLHDFIGRKMLDKGLYISNRYSPGYCNWSVSEQQLLFSLLPDNMCGVSLNESSLMSPIKSVSGIIGIGAEVKYQEYICDRCGVKDCTHRIKLMEKTK